MVLTVVMVASRKDCNLVRGIEYETERTFAPSLCEEEEEEKSICSWILIKSIGAVMNLQGTACDKPPIASI